MLWFILIVLLSVISYPNMAHTHDIPHFSADGYRISYYRSATPNSIDEATLITTEDLVSKMHETPKLILIDVHPVTWRNGIFILQSPRESLPNSVWLPNVGWGEAEEHWIRYFSDHLSLLTEQDKNKEIVIFCTANCWMSWNAVRRAAKWGYNKLYWYSEGTDGWSESGLPLVEITPEPLGVEALLFVE